MTASPSGGSDVYTPSGKRKVSGAYIQEKLTWEWLEVIGGAALRQLRARRRLGATVPATGCRRASPSASRRSSAGLARRAAVLRHLCRRLPLAVADGNADQRPASERRHLPVPAQSEPQARDRARPANSASTTAGRHCIQADDSLRLKAAYFNNDVDDYIGGTDARRPSTRPAAARSVPPDPQPDYIPICFQYQNFAKAKIKGFELESVYDAGWGFAGLSASIIDGHTISYEGVAEDLDHHPVLAGHRPARLPLPRGQADGRRRGPVQRRAEGQRDRRRLYAGQRLRELSGDRELQGRLPRRQPASTCNTPTRSTHRRRRHSTSPASRLKLAATMRFGG